MFKSRHLFQIVRRTTVRSQSRCRRNQRSPLFLGQTDVAVIQATSGAYYRHKSTDVSQTILNPEQILETDTIYKEKVSLEEVLKELDFNDHKEAFKSKTLGEVLRALVIFRLCNVDFLVDHQLKLLKATRVLLGKKFFRKLMKKSVYGQFMAGENRQEFLENVKRFSKCGILPLLGYTAAETHGATWSHNTTDDIYKSNIEMLLDSFDLGQCCKEFVEDDVIPKCTGKLTFLKPHHALVEATKLIEHNNRFIRAHFGNDKVSSPSQQKRLTKQLQDIAEKHEHAPGKGTVDIDGLLMNIDFHFDVFQKMKNEPEYGFESGDNSNLWMKEIREMGDTLSKLSQGAIEKSVCMVWDAEQTYLQPAIDVLVLEQMRKFNKDRVVVYGTYQCYLKRTFDNIYRDLNIAKREGFKFGAKVVRGAYMDEERALAVQEKYEDPVHPDFEATTAMYHKTATFLLKEIKANPRGMMHVIIASHNDQTIRFVLEKMHSLGVEPDGDLLWFAQLFGMRDHLAFPLSQKQLPAAKLLQYGDVEGGVAYLSRRVAENRHSINTPCGAQERALLWKEFKHRLSKSR